MAELQFCKQFLSALDARSVKLSSDHIADAHQYPAQQAYTLPRLPSPHPSRPRPKSSSPSTAPSSGTLTITLTPLKPTFPSVPLTSIPASTTSIFDLKTFYSTSTAIPVSKVKILWKKKPVADSKTVAEVIGSDAGSDVEFAVMVLGGATVGTSSPSAGTPAASPLASPPAAVPAQEEKGIGGPAAQGPFGKEVVAGKEFWEDLEGFVIQRIRDQKEGERLVEVFREAWEGNR